MNGQRSAARVFVVVLLAACGGERARSATPTTSDSTSDSASTSDSTSPSTSDSTPTPTPTSTSESTPTHDASPPPPEATADAGECTTAADCQSCMISEPITRAADCRCTTCSGGSMPRTTCDANMASYHSVCAAWLAHHDCPPVSCAAVDTYPVCREGRCVEGP